MRPIEIMQHPDEASRTPSMGCAWVATCEIAGRRFTARSRHGAPNALARQLVEAGIADHPVEVREIGRPGAMRYRSLHKMAGYTYTEGNHPLKRKRYIAPADRIAILRTREGQNRGISTDRLPDALPAVEAAE